MFYKKKNQKKILMILLTLMLLSGLILFIQSQLVNNLSWLEGKWSNRHENYTFIAKNKSLTIWEIKGSRNLELDKVTVTINSNKSITILTDDSEKVTCCIDKINSKEINLCLYKGNKQVKIGDLNKKDD